MRRVIVPALLAIVLAAGSSANANAFGLFSKLCNSGCDTCCDVEPACGCEAPVDCGCAMEPACGCEVAAPVCGCEVVDPCCDSGCGKKHGGLLAKLFSKKSSCCDSGCAAPCEPACGCEVIEPACGCEVAAPVCGCEVVDPCCTPKRKPFGLFKKLFSCKDSCCDSGCAAPCEPTCGCEVIEPACGCEVAAPACGCH